MTCHGAAVPYQRGNNVSWSSRRRERRLDCRQILSPNNPSSFAFAPQCAAHPPHNASWPSSNLPMEAPARAPPPPPLLPLATTGAGTTAPPPSTAVASATSSSTKYSHARTHARTHVRTYTIVLARHIPHLQRHSNAEHNQAHPLQ